jgi:penicillin-binding protein 1C
MRRLLTRRWRRALLVGALAPLVGLAILLTWVGDRVALDAPDATRFVVDRDGRFLGEHPAANGTVGYWAVDPLPPRMVAATLAAEDRRYFNHRGVDVQAVARAVSQNLFHGQRISGASTVAMQVARMQRPAPRIWRHKVQEAATALRLIHRHGHRAVLAHYLRVAPYGQNIHGVGYAARRYFDKPIGDLSWAETAILAGLPQSPRRYDLHKAKGLRAAKARARRILNLLRSHGDLKAADLGRALAELDTLTARPRPTRPAAALHALMAPELRGGVPFVQATLDLPLQRWLQATLERAVNQGAERGIGNAAAVVIDLQDDFSVRAAVGSARWADAAAAGALDYTRVLRSPGSTLKPFLFAAALDNGRLRADEPLDDLDRATDGIGNADGRFLGPMLPRQALANSRNVPAIEIAERLGVHETWALLRRLGLGPDANPGAEHYGPALALGAMPVRMLNLLGAYTAFPGDGVPHSLRWRRSDPARAGARIFSAQTARLVGQWLSDPMARLPSFRRHGALELPFPAALKTGTSRNYRDAWTVGWTDRYLVAVWVGRPDWRPMRRVSGSRGAAPILKALLSHLHPDRAEGLTDGRLPTPAGYTTTPVCALSGGRATPACDHVVEEWFGEPPTQDCAAHVALHIDGRTGAPATVETPAEATERRIFVDLPGRYATWMARAGLSAPPGRVGVGIGTARGRRVRVLSPRPGQQILRDPEAPGGWSTLRLAAAVEGASAASQVVWYVDGEPHAVVEGPTFETRWPVVGGEHVFEAHLLGGARSGGVRIVAR